MPRVPGGNRAIDDSDGEPRNRRRSGGADLGIDPVYCRRRIRLRLYDQSRDMLVRGAAPAGATGTVFGFVYSASISALR